MKIRTIIIDDEKLARQELRYQLKDFSNIEIIDEAENVDEALSKIAELKPDLIFLDISMPEKNGFDLLEELDQAPAVIFITAHDQFAIKAFESNALDYILKPIRAERLQLAIQKVEEEVKTQKEEILKYKKFEREQSGKYTLIFPFNEITEELAITLNKMSSSSGNSQNVGGPNIMKQLINEVKIYYDEKLLFIKS